MVRRVTRKTLWMTLSAALLPGCFGGFGFGGIGERALTNALYDSPNLAARQQKCDAFGQAQVGLPEERALGGAVALNWVHRSTGLLLEGKEAVELNRYLNQVGKNLALQSERPGLEWTFGVLNTDEVNAYSAPGGYVMLSRGLLRLIESEAALAGVLAHEIA